MDIIRALAECMQVNEESPSKQFLSQLTRSCNSLMLSRRCNTASYPRLKHTVQKKADDSLNSIRRLNPSHSCTTGNIFYQVLCFARQEMGIKYHSTVFCLYMVHRGGQGIEYRYICTHRKGMYADWPLEKRTNAFVKTSTGIFPSTS